jgi:hypothetical protein
MLTTGVIMNNETNLLSRKEKFAYVNTSFDLNIPEQKALYEKFNQLSESMNEKKTTVMRKLLSDFLANKQTAQ